MSGLIIILAVCAGLLAFGIWKHLHDGRMRATREHQARERLTSAQIGAELGERATLLQFTSAFCSPCRATRRILDEVAQMTPGVVHVDLDVEQYLDLVNQLDVTRTPTVMVLDADGAIIRRAAGQPRKADVIAALGEAIPA